MKRAKSNGVDGVAGLATVEPTASSSRPRSLVDVIADIDRRVQDDQVDMLRPVPTGFSPLDDFLNGGLRSGDLTLVAGGHGVGKTTFVLHLARNMAAAGANTIYVCYEHLEEALATRLLSAESAGGDGSRSGLTTAELDRLLLVARRRGEAGLAALAASDERLRRALERADGYANRLHVLRGSGRLTTLDALQELAERARASTSEPVVMCVDYLQKVPVEGELPDGARVTRVVEGLKELALAQRIVVVAIAALDQDGLRAKRIRAHHLSGGSALAYETDLLLLLTEKYDRVARIHKEFNPQKAQSYREWVVLSIEKNRSGRALVDLEYRKQFKYCAFDPNGGVVTEKLDDE